MSNETLPPLPETIYGLFYESDDAGDGDGTYQEFVDAPGYSAEQMRAYAHAAIAQVLERSGQYLTNDASRESAIAEAVSAAILPRLGFEVVINRNIPAGVVRAYLDGKLVGEVRNIKEPT